MNSENNNINNQGQSYMQDSNDKGFFFSERFSCMLFGMLIILLSILTFLNQGPISSFLAYCLVYVFGVFIFPLLSMAILIGLYMIIKGKLPKFRVNFTGLGYILIILFGCLAASRNVEMDITNFGVVFSERFSTLVASPFALTTLNTSGYVGGGFLGYLFASLFKTGMGEIGSFVFCIIFLVIGSFLVLRIPVLRVVEDIKDYSLRRQLKRQGLVESVQNKEEPKQEEEITVNKANPFSKEVVNTPKEKKKDDKRLFGIQRNETPSLSIASTPIISSEVKPSTYDTTFIKKSSFVDEDIKEEKGLATSPFTSPSYSINQNNVEPKPLTSTERVVEPTPVNPQPSPVSAPTPSKEPSLEELYAQFEKERQEEKEKAQPVKEEAPTPYHQPNMDRLSRNTTTFEVETKPFEQEPAAIKKEVERKPAPATAPTRASVSLEPKEEEKPVQESENINETYSYPLPSITLLEDREDYSKLEQNQAAAQAKIPIINGVYQKLNINAQVKSFTIGPSVTRFNIMRQPGVKVSQITSSDVEQELKIDLKGDFSVRLEAVVRGQDTSGVEIGNVAPTMVPFYKAFGAVLAKNSPDKMLMPLGMDISSEVICDSMDALPHLLVAGTTGSGKSVFIHSLIMTFIMRNYPSELKIILVDPKKVEFTRYRDMPHLFCPIITDITYAIAMLKRLVEEMERRYQILSRYECSNTHDYEKLRKERPELEQFPNIVCIIDEFADLMSQDPKNVDNYTQRLAQKARAAGIYLIIATQRPSVKNIPGTIKANIPARIALYLPTGIDSRTILDEEGAEKLLGKGDLLARTPSLKSTMRLQSAYVSNEEISKVVSYLKSQAKPHYNSSFVNLAEDESDLSKSLGITGEGRKLPGFSDELYMDVRAHVMATRVASTSSIQRHFSIGFSRAASILDALEEEGIVRTVAGNRKEVVMFETDDGAGINTGE